MKQVSTEFIDALRQDSIHTKIKVIAEFGNNRFNNNQIVSASSTKLVNRLYNNQNPYSVFWQPGDVFNNITRNCMYYAVCDRGAKAVSVNSGQPAYRAAPTDTMNITDIELERGWWSLFKSDFIPDWAELAYNDSAWQNAVSCGSPGGSGIPTNTYTDWYFHDEIEGIIFNMDMFINVRDINNPYTDSYNWTQQFRFRGPDADRGYMRIQNDSNGKLATFFIKRALAARGPEIVEAFDGGYHTSITYDWQAKTTYRLGLSALELDGSNRWWGCWITDMYTNIPTHVGDILIPQDWSWISPGPHTCQIQRYGGRTPNNSFDIGYVTGDFLTKLNGYTILPYTWVNHFDEPQHAANSKICGIRSFIFRLTNAINIFLGTGHNVNSFRAVRQTIGYNLNNPPKDEDGYNCIYATGAIDIPWGKSPSGWPDVNALWIWNADAHVPVKAETVWFRKIVNVGIDTPCTIYATADNAFQCYVNGSFVFDGGDTVTIPVDIDNDLPAQNLGFAMTAEPIFGWEKLYNASITLTAGDNILAFKAMNYGSGTGNTPAGLLVTVKRNSDGVVLARSDTSWKWIVNDNSGTSGTFIKPEFVEATFDSRKINQIKLFTTEGYPNMSSVKVEYLDANLNNWITVSDLALDPNTYEYTFNLDTFKNCKGLRGSVNGTVHPHDYARISEINGLYVLDISDDVVSAQLNEAREEYTNTVPVGMTRANTLNLTLDNSDEKYSPDLSQVPDLSTPWNIDAYAGTGESKLAPYPGSGPSFGDGGPALSAKFNNVVDGAFDSGGNLFVADENNERIRRIDHTTHIITSVVGTGSPNYTGDGGPATSATLTQPSAICFDSFDNYYIAHFDATMGFPYGSIIRKVTPGGIISTFVNRTAWGFSGTTGIGFSNMVCDSNNNIYIPGYNANKIYKVTPAGSVSVFAGIGGAEGYSGDGGLATAAQLASPIGVGIDDEFLYFGDEDNNVFRKINLQTNIIETIAGTGVYDYTGDGGPALEATFNFTGCIASDQGNLFIVDSFAIRKIDSAGIITTIAGGVQWHYPYLGQNGDGGPALGAKFNNPLSIKIYNNQIYIFDDQAPDDMVRVITPNKEATSINKYITANTKFTVSLGVER